MRRVLAAVLALAVVAIARADEPAKQVQEGKKLPPGLILQSPSDSKQSYDLGKLVEDGPVLVRLTCACSGCDKELPQFQKLQEAYNAKGLKTLAVFREKPEATSDYAAKKDLKFLWLSDPKGELWKTFDTKAMPTNILIDKGGRVVKVLPGCTVDGKNAQALSAEIAKLLKTDEVKIVEDKKSKDTAMIDGPSVAAALRECGVTHVVWVPDSDLGTWEGALRAEPGLRLVRVCREGEAVAVAGGLCLGGQRPVVVMQCTGFFEAGDSFRNFVHDLKLPLFFVIGVRGYFAHQKGATADTCPVFAEPVLRAWGVPGTLLDRRATAADLAAAYRAAQGAGRAGAVLLAE